MFMDRCSGLSFSCAVNVLLTYIFLNPEYCGILSMNPIVSPRTFTCITTVPQSQITRVDMTLGPLSKSAYTYFQFKGSVTPGTQIPTSSFNIQLTMNQPTTGATNLGFFILVIKNQPSDKIIDFITFCNYDFNQDFSPNSNLATTTGTGRTSQASRNITRGGATIFNSVANLEIRCFASWFTILPRTDPGGNLISTEYMLYSLTSEWSTSFAGILTTNLYAGINTRIIQFKGIVLLYNPVTISNVNTIRSWNMTVSTLSIESSASSYNFTNHQSRFGPSFNSKCLLGYHYLQYVGDKGFYYEFQDSMQNNYERFTYSSLGNYFKGTFFCFGNGSECGQPNIYYDEITKTCNEEQNCPLPVPHYYSNASYCPKCIQIICTSCDPANRSVCYQCGPNSTLVNGKCVCNYGYWEKTIWISDPAAGLWNGVKYSLTKCQYNCTALFPNCMFKQCQMSHPGHCYQCIRGYFPKYTYIGTSPYEVKTSVCELCSIHHPPQCLSCYSETQCQDCASGYYRKNQNPPSNTVVDCDRCSNNIAYCATCDSNGIICWTCNHGYKFSSSSTCICDASVMNGCATCSAGFTCTSCLSDQFYFDSTVELCFPCSQIHWACETCSIPLICTKCAIGHLLRSVANGATCVSCGSLIGNCTQCSSGTVCTNCDYGFGLTPTSPTVKCQKCTSLLPDSSCENCEDSSNCLVCMPRYFLILDTLSGKKVCKSCLNIFDYCETCDIGQCFTCEKPYLIGPDGNCTDCIPGYQSIAGVCASLTGCQTEIILLNGTKICVACMQQLHFTFDNRLQKCVCIQGFKQSYRIGFLPTCTPICGDGIILSGFQDCDDNNTANGDGCNQVCKPETGFNCTGEPSTCILNLNIRAIYLSSVSKVFAQNTGIISFTILPIHAGLEVMPWKKMIQFNFSSSLVETSQLNFQYSSVTGQLRVTVPYKKELQGTDFGSAITLDPQYIVSNPSFFKLQNRLKGVNAALTFEEQSTLQTQKSINTISLVMMILLLLQFYVGSYFHKMIGLETIQVIQSIYFVRMVAKSKQTTLLNSINIIQYSAGGYANAGLFYGDSIAQVSKKTQDLMPSEFLTIGMERYFLMNTNLFLLPIGLALFVYIISLVRKYRARSGYIQTQELELKDSYFRLRRSAQWVYDHFVFPWVIMFNSICIFSSVLQFSSSQPIGQQDQTQKTIETQSLIALRFTLLVTMGIYCYEVISSYYEYSRYLLPKEERERAPVSLIEKLQYDGNNTDRANYHPLYIFVYLIFSFVLSLVMALQVLVPSFNYSLQMVMGFSAAYFILICFWKPYHSSINIHNHFLKLYYGTYAIFTFICYLIAKFDRLPEDTYIGLVYIVMTILVCILLGGFARIFFQIRYRKALEEEDSILQWKIDDQDLNVIKNYQYTFSKRQNDQSLGAINKKTRKQALLKKNQYVFANQLKELSKIYIPNQLSLMNGLEDGQSGFHFDEMCPQQQQTIIKTIKQEQQKQREFIKEQSWKQKMKLQNLKTNEKNWKGNEKQTKQIVECQKDYKTKERKGKKVMKIEQIEQLRSIKAKLRNQHAIMQI